ncbi:HAD domain-containing protein [Burkholderia sp. 8Y]|uniref:HAD domain-containing protein n=1 Tax=Burkholderia sp. 8Y TaxID=2653133 RepID=UPI00135768EC|nr:HAD domain-containing protein [Burkholderia sp. 8Y]
MLTEPIGLSSTIPPPRIRGGDVLYVDFDACLHPADVYVKRGIGPYLRDRANHGLFEQAPLLDGLLSSYPHVMIVLSTSWVVRYRGSIARVAARLPVGLRRRVIGATYHTRMDRDAFVAAPRGMQIWSDVLRRRPARWLAIDDDAQGWPEWCRDNLVKTDETFGIGEPAVRVELESKLQATFGETI